MAYDEKLAARVRERIQRRKGIVEKKMFGGLAFMLNGHMCCGVNDDNLMLRLGNEGTAAALLKAHTADMDFTGRPLKSMIYVRPAGIRTDAALRDWVEQALTFARSLPPKPIP